MTHSPAVIIFSYTRDGGHFYLHIPKRLARECGLTSGCRFLCFVRDGKRLIIEQEGMIAQLGTGQTETG